MLSIGKMNKLTIDRIVDMNAYLSSEKGDVILPIKHLPENVQAGDSINVFVYKDTEGRLMATATRPLAEVGDIAILEVVDVNNAGAFLAWGMDKDLLLPYRSQLKPVVPGQKCVIKVLLDANTGMVIASTKLRPFLKLNDGSLSAGKKASALFFDESEVGFTAIVNDTYLAMLHRPDAAEHIKIGESRTVYIKRVLPEGQIELSLRKVGYEAVIETRAQLLEALKNANGFLPFTDKSSPKEILDHLNMSKKSFKKVVGTLYKEKKIKLENDGIRLLKLK